MSLYFSAPSFTLCKGCASFSQSPQGSIWKSKCFFHLHLLWRLNCSEIIFTFLFHLDIIDVWSWQIWISFRIEVMALVASTRLAHCPGCGEKLVLALWVRRAGWGQGEITRQSSSPWVITVTSLELADDRQQTWPKQKRKNSYIWLRDITTAKGSVVFLLSLLDQGLFSCGHSAEKQMPLTGRNQLLPETLYSLLRPTTLRFCCGPLQHIQIPSPWSAENTRFSAVEREAEQTRYISRPGSTLGHCRWLWEVFAGISVTLYIENQMLPFTSELYL